MAKKGGKAASSNLMRSMALTFVAFQCALVLYQMLAGSSFTPHTNIAEYTPPSKDDGPELHAYSNDLNKDREVTGKKKKARLKRTDQAVHESIIVNTSSIDKHINTVANVTTRPRKLVPRKTPQADPMSDSIVKLSTKELWANITMKERKAVAGDPLPAPENRRLRNRDFLPDP